MKKLKVQAIFLIIIICAVLVSGCSTEKAASKGEKTSLKTEISEEDNNKIIKLIKDYTEKLYSGNVEEYYTNGLNGVVNNKIKDFAAQKTLKEALNNKEIPIHYPRFVSINGLTVLEYEVYKNGENSEILIDYIGKVGEVVTYYVKVNLIGKTAPENDFNMNYTRDTMNGIYVKNPGSSLKASDEIRVQVKYDFNIIKDGDDYKILTATESSIKPNMKSRLLISNNNFIDRLPYLSVVKSDDGSITPNKKDLELYEKDKEVIKNYFDKLINIDSYR